MAYTFSDKSQVGIRAPTWQPIPAAGISSTPKSNATVTHHYVVDQTRRQRFDVFPEELTWGFTTPDIGAGGSAPQCMYGWHTVNNFLTDNNNELALEIGRCNTTLVLDRYFTFVGSLLSNPEATSADGQHRVSNNEAFAIAGRARLQDVWGCEFPDGLPMNSRLFANAVRRTKKQPGVTWAAHPRQTRALLNAIYEWWIEPSFDPGWSPSIAAEYCSTERDADGGEWRGSSKLIGSCYRPLTMQQGGQKNFGALKETYLDVADPVRQFKAYNQMRSLEVILRH